MCQFVIIFFLFCVCTFSRHPINGFQWGYCAHYQAGCSGYVCVCVYALLLQGADSREVCLNKERSTEAQFIL